MKLNRAIYQSLLIISFLAINALIIFGISAVWSYLNTGADRSKMLHLPEALASSYIPEIKWDLENIEGRPIENQTLNEIEKDYLKSWQVRNIALETNNKFGLSDYFTDSARVKLYQLIDLNQMQKTSLKSTTLKHQPKLEFYSADGKLAILTDRDVLQFQENYLENVLVYSQKTISTIRVMLLLEDGFWRVRHMVVLESKNIEHLATSSKKRHNMDWSLIKGVNYYPQQNPWDMFGKNFKDTTIHNDLEKIKEVGLNTIRVFVPYEAFGKAEIDVVKLDQLYRTLDIASRHDLKVMVTLFDFYGDYRIHDWTLTFRHAEQIVKRIKDHPALLGWDLKNEPDLDFASRGKSNVLSWLEQLIEEVNNWDGNHPVTIGWSNADAAEHLSQKVDFVSFHYYLNPDSFSDTYTNLKKRVPNKPIVLQEYGLSSYSGLWNLYRGSTKKQANYFEKMHKEISSLNIPYLFWTFYDFEDVPNSVVGRLPWRKAKQKNFGLLDKEGRPKKALESIKESIKKE